MLVGGGGDGNGGQIIKIFKCTVTKPPENINETIGSASKQGFMAIIIKKFYNRDSRKKLDQHFYCIDLYIMYIMLG